MTHYFDTPGGEPRGSSLVDIVLSVLDVVFSVLGQPRAPQGAAPVAGTDVMDDVEDMGVVCVSVGSCSENHSEGVVNDVFAK